MSDLADIGVAPLPLLEHALVFGGPAPPLVGVLKRGAVVLLLALPVVLLLALLVYRPLQSVPVLHYLTVGMRLVLLLELDQLSVALLYLALQTLIYYQ